MARIKGAVTTRARRKKILKAAKGYWGAKSRHFKMAKQQVMKSGNYAFIGRKQKKRDFRRLWITRISAACKANGMNYSTFMNTVMSLRARFTVFSVFVASLRTMPTSLCAASRLLMKLWA